jgi:hypothetical protein
MNHAAIFTIANLHRENRFDEERNEEGCKEGREKGSSQEEKVS